MEISILDTGLVYRNPRPHLQSRHAYFPSVVVRSDGNMLASMDIGSAFEAVDVRSFVCSSSDRGKTWTEPRRIFEPDPSDHPVSTSCRVALMPDGELLGLACLFDRNQVDIGLGNPATDGFVRTQMALIRSPDEGRSWSAPEPISPPLDWHHFETCSPIISATGTRRLMPTSLWPDWEGQCPHGLHRAIAFISDDAGRTWPKWTSVMDGSADRISGWEQKMIMLADGRLMAVCWCFDFKSRKNLPNRYAFSENNGDTFSPPMDSPLHGETCTPVALRDNHILCVYRRADQRGLWAHLARIDGRTWRPLADLPLWGTAVESHDTTNESILGQMSTLRFGYPSVAAIDDEELFAAFWCVEDCVSNIRWFRIGVLL